MRLALIFRSGQRTPDVPSEVILKGEVSFPRPFSFTLLAEQTFAAGGFTAGVSSF